MTRIIEVEKCHPHHCPWCTENNELWNWCEAVSGLRIERVGKVKTFPKCCPLKDKKGEG